jgi:probable phosphoglycerate mutase
LDRFEMTHTLRGGNKEADRLANEAMDQGMGKGSAAGGVSGISRAASQQVGGSARPAAAKSPAAPKAPQQVLEGYVKDGVVHLLGGELPDGVFVKITRQ